MFVEVMFEINGSAEEQKASLESIREYLNRKQDLGDIHHLAIEVEGQGDAA